MKNVKNRAVSPLQVVFETAAIAGVIVHAATIARVWTTLADRIPTHFGVSGQPDKWGSKVELLVLPGLSLLLYALLTWIGRYAHKFNYPWDVTEQNAARQYQLGKSLVIVIKAQVMWLFAIITWQSVRVAMGQPEGLGPAFVPVVLIVSMATLIVYFWLASRSS